MRWAQINKSFSQIRLDGSSDGVGGAESWLLSFGTETKSRLQLAFRPTFDKTLIPHSHMKPFSVPTKPIYYSCFPIKVHLEHYKLMSDMKLFKSFMISYVYSFDIWAQLLRVWEQLLLLFEFLHLSTLQPDDILSFKLYAREHIKHQVWEKWETSSWDCRFGCCKQPKSPY